MNRATRYFRTPSSSSESVNAGLFKRFVRTTATAPERRGASRRTRVESLEPRINLSAAWPLEFGGPGEDVPRAGVETDSDGNVYIAGDFFDSIQVDPLGGAGGLLTSTASESPGS